MRQFGPYPNLRGAQVRPWAAHGNERAARSATVYKLRDRAFTAGTAFCLPALLIPRIPLTNGVRATLQAPNSRPSLCRIRGRPHCCETPLEIDEEERTEDRNPKLNIVRVSGATPDRATPSICARRLIPSRSRQAFLWRATLDCLSDVELAETDQDEEGS
jgi:hypothetical protein